MFDWFWHLWFTGSTYAQDILYLQKSTEKGKITEITPTFVTYQKKSSSLPDPHRQDPVCRERKRDVLVPSKLLMDNPYDQAHIRHFIAADTAYAQGDRLYTSPDSLYQGKIVKEDRTFVYLADNSKIDKRSLMAVGSMRTVPFNCLRPPTRLRTSLRIFSIHRRRRYFRPLRQPRRRPRP